MRHQLKLIYNLLLGLFLEECGATAVETFEGILKAIKFIYELVKNWTDKLCILHLLS